MSRPLIAVIGGSSPSDAAVAAAESIGFLLAEHGLSVVCGGMSGIMEATTRSLRQTRDRLGTDSLAIGVLPGPDAVEANPFIDVAIPTGMGIARNVLVVRSATVVIVVEGGSGTLSEIAFAWQLGKPIIALQSSGGVAAAYAGAQLDGRRSDHVLVATTPEEAVHLAMELLG